jgi:hypothetical protein
MCVSTVGWAAAGSEKAAVPKTRTVLKYLRSPENIIAPPGLIF